MNPFVYEVTCSVCGEKGMAPPGPSPWLADYRHSDPQVCADNLKRKQKELEKKEASIKESELVVEKKEVDIETLKKTVLDEAKDRRDHAGLNGRGIDGADNLEDQVKWYTYGQNGEIPPEWASFLMRLDPEYETYLRLKEKFE